MGDYTASDCSWKKMVIAKANDAWTSTIKPEGSEESAPSTKTFSADYSDVKQESEEVGPSQGFTQDLNDDSLFEDLDPLFIDESPQPRRRRESRVKSETPEERSVRLAKLSAYAAKRLANETAEQRAKRLQRMSEYAARRLRQETSEQRAKRLQRMSAYAARRLAEESPEQRKARLARMSAYAAKRQAVKRRNRTNMSPSDTFDPDVANYMKHFMEPDQS